MPKLVLTLSFLFVIANSTLSINSASAEYPSGSYKGYLNLKSVSSSLSGTVPASISFTWKFSKHGSKYTATEISTGRNFSATKSGDNALAVKVSSSPVVRGVPCKETDTVKVTKQPSKKAAGSFSAKISCNNGFKGTVSYKGNFKNGVGTTVPVTTPGSGGGNTKK